MLTHNCITVENGFFFGVNMLYEKNKEASLSPELFKNPTAEYRSTPFWAWNSNLDRAELARQIDAFAEMGTAGSANLATIAPSISAALVTTVVGLLIAIPGVLAYTRMNATITQIRSEMEGFADELMGRIACEFQGRGV